MDKKTIRICPVCTNNMYFGKKIDNIKYKNNNIVINDVEAWWCSCCEEAIYTGDSLDKIDEAVEKFKKEKSIKSTKKHITLPYIFQKQLA